MTSTTPDRDFSGAKLALFLGPALVVLRRDDRPDIPWPNALDLPGGGADAGESPEACVIRETREEVGLHVAPSDLVWRRRYLRPGGRVWFFAAHMPVSAGRDMRLGDEGQECGVMDPGEFAASREAVPHLAEQVRLYLAVLERGGTR